MYIRLSLLALATTLFIFSPYSLAADKKTGVTTDDKGESIIRKQSLAAHMGLTASDVAFGEPRNFRSHGTQEVQLEPLSADLEDAAPTEMPGE